MPTAVENPAIQTHYIIEGDTSLLDRSPTVILNSRQTKTPVGNDLWVRKTLDAVKDAVQQGTPLIGSVGMNTWEMVLWAIGNHNGSGIIICPLKNGEGREEVSEKIASDFGLRRDDHLWIYIPVERSFRSSKSWWGERDNLAVRLAEIIIPVSLNPNGGLSRLIAKQFSSKLTDEKSYQVEFHSRTSTVCSLDVPDTCRHFDNWHYLTHWTKRIYGPWPGEKSADYYRAVVSCGDEYPRQAIHTLIKILDEKLIRASGNNIRDGKEVVAFTSLAPSDALPLMRWRRRFVKPNFEPYGIAINYRSALKLGIRPVTYVDSSEKKPDSPTPPTPPEFFQGYGTGEWPKEKEWRAAGDIDLSLIPPDDIIVIVPSEIEAEKIQRDAGFRIVTLS